MKVIKILALVAVALPMVFISCSNDDDNKSSGSPSEDTSVITTADGNKLLISKINSDLIFKYDDLGRCTYLNSWNSWFFTISYDPYKVEVTSDEDESVSCSLSFNGSGYISKCTWSETYDDGEESGSGSETTTLSYNSNGQLTSATNNYSGKEKFDGESYSYSGKVTLNITWEGGNMTKMAINQTEKGDGYSYSDSYTYTYSYGDIENKYRQYTVDFDQTSADCLDCIADFCLIGYMGIGSAYLPTSVKMEGEENEDGDVYNYDYTYNCSYTLNEDGTISTEKSDYDTTYRYTYANLDSDTRSAVETPFDEAFSLAKKPSKLMHGIRHRLHSRRTEVKE